MDVDRPVVDGRDIFESELQELLLEAWVIGTNDGENDDWSNWQEELYPKLHELLISYLDGPTDDVGTQDEASEEGEMGDGVRQEEYIERWYEGEIPEGWKKSPNATASDFFRQYSGQYRRLQNPR